MYPFLFENGDWFFLRFLKNLRPQVAFSIVFAHVHEKAIVTENVTIFYGSMRIYCTGIKHCDVIVLLPFHTSTAKQRFQTSQLWRGFWKGAFSVTFFIGYVRTLGHGLRAVSLFLQIYWGECTRARRETRKTCLSRLAPSVTRVVICVSRAFCSMDQEKRDTARSLVRPWTGEKNLQKDTYGRALSCDSRTN